MSPVRNSEENSESPGEPILLKEVEMSSEVKRENWFFLMLTLAVLLLSFLLIRPLVNALLTAIVLAYLFYPVYSWLKKRVRNESAAALIITLVLVLLMTVPILFLLKALTGELFQVYFGAKKILLNIESLCTEEGLVCSLIKFYKTFSLDPQLRLPLENLFSKATVYLIDKVSNFLLTLPARIVELFIILFSTYYLLKNGKQLIIKLESFVPLKTEYKDHLFSRIESSVKGVVYGNVLIASVQAILALAGFYVLGVPQPIILGALTFFAALLPLAGAAVVWLPASAVMTINSIAQQNNALLFKGVALFAYGAFVVSTIDNIIKPKIIGKRAGIHPLLVLLGVFGGLKLFGLPGFIIGPALLAVLVTLADIYSKEQMLK